MAEIPNLQSVPQLQGTSQVQDAATQTELLRRRAAMPASSAGIGAALANTLEPSNAIAAGGGPELLTNPTIPGSNQGGGASGQPTAEAIGQLKQEKGESQTIIEALIWRLKRTTPPQADTGLSSNNAGTILRSI